MNSASMNSREDTKTSTTKMKKDPIGAAILDYSNTGISKDIIVSSDICEDDVIPSSYLFRSFDEMPESEQIALNRASGKILDIGAAAGAHAKYLRSMGSEVKCIDISPGAVKYLKSQGYNASQKDVLQLNGEKFDTLLLLMNGIGISGSLDQLDSFIEHLNNLLNEGGKILCDSTDIKYLYEDEDGGYWMDLNSDYYGNFNFKMSYDDHEGDWFPWLYVDYQTLKEHVEATGLMIEKIFQEESHYLAEIKR